MKIKIKHLRKIIRETFQPATSGQNIITLSDKIEDMLRTFYVLTIEKAMEDYNVNDASEFVKNNSKSMITDPMNDNPPTTIHNNFQIDTTSFEVQKELAADDLYNRLKPLMTDKIVQITQDVVDKIKNKEYLPNQDPMRENIVKTHK